MMKNITKGSCLCGKISFEVIGNFENFILCHCTHCKKGTGSAHASNLFSDTAKLNWTSGEELVTSFNLTNTRHCRSFCSVCGSSMPSLLKEGGFIMVPAGSLDDEISIRPSAKIFMASQFNWEHDLGSVKNFERLPK
jgi:hypothetical protein